MKKIKRKELYRIPISIDLIDELIELGRLLDKKDKIVNWIYENGDLSNSLKLSWMTQYSREWHEQLQDLALKMRKKINLENEENVFSFDYAKKELVVLDMLRSEYEEACRENDYLVRVIYE